MMSVSLEALETSSPTLIQTLSGWKGEISCVDVFGGRLAAAAGDNLKLWTWEKSGGWRLAASATKAHRYGVTSARWSPTGVLLASAGVDGVVRVWCGRTLAVRRLLSAPAAPAVRSLAWAGSGRILAGHDDGALCVWSVLTGGLLARLQAHQGALHALTAPGKGRLVLAACTEGVLKVFDLMDICKSSSSPPTPVLWADGAHDLGVLCADSNEDGTLAATGGHDGKVKVWRFDGTEPRVLEGHMLAVCSVSWGSRYLGSASLDRTARLWCPHSGSTLTVIQAHSRYLTCVAVCPMLRYVVTGSNDKTVRMWSIGSFTKDDDLEPPCIAHEHFGVGDLEGISPIDVDDLLELEANDNESSESEGAKLLWRDANAHSGAINSIATHKNLLVTASSDGTIKTYNWNSTKNTLDLGHVLGDGGYPILAVDLGANGALLLSAGLDTTAFLWDVESGSVLRSLPTSPVGGCGVRGARLSARLAPLLAADDGLVAVWALGDMDPTPHHVYDSQGDGEASLCVSWSPDCRLCAVGGANGQLRVCAAPPNAKELAICGEAHDLGVQSCDFAPSSLGLEPSAGVEAVYLLATGGCDANIKLWLVELIEDITELSATLTLLQSIEAHFGGVSCVRFSPTSPLLSSGGADSWARLWKVEKKEKIRLSMVCGIPSLSAGGALATGFLDDNIISVGTLSGELSLWKFQVPEESESETEDCASETEIDVRGWGEGGVADWIRDYVTRVPGSPQPRELEASLLEKVRENKLTGAKLLDDPVEELLEMFGYGAEIQETEEVEQENSYLALRNRLTEEINWLRVNLKHELLWLAPHSLLCPLSHRLTPRPVRAADGITYDSAAIWEWTVASDSLISPVSGRKMRNSKIHPNYKSRELLKQFLAEHQN